MRFILLFAQKKKISEHAGKSIALICPCLALYAESGPPCCEYKEVGGIYYKLVGEGNPDSKFECMSPCIYYNISDPASR